jgi:hypothetical protein
MTVDELTRRPDRISELAQELLPMLQPIAFSAGVSELISIKEAAERLELSVSALYHGEGAVMISLCTTVRSCVPMRLRWSTGLNSIG